ncbi:hypothetical protein PGT21_034987 [Puccinia graminis f. sp. tritici]|uniref:DUF7727 domain-containing protein n=1 Tax=Puccinia graminis f. sp. tritici TaxID=56615 RepID=A0A5B0PZW1_PUCGR|nr:hypothetical protein PGT21_034987 [Puccinia graminis f. sp. tritici]KAA1126368.1 hypothetical protein PGTUg99_029635 [Puccinia graminis f. sp. tritici]
MGNLIWSDWGRLVALTAGYWNAWGALWAIFYRKYFWDFVGGKLGPVGTIPPGFAAPFIQFIVTIPVIQAVCFLCGLLTVVFEWPVFPGMFLYRSLAFKTVFYLISGVVAGLLYQTADASVIYLVAILAYSVALGKGEIVGEKATNSSRV